MSSRLTRTEAEAELAHAERRHQDADRAVAMAASTLKAAEEDLRTATTARDRAAEDVVAAEDFERAASPADRASFEAGARALVYGTTRRLPRTSGGTPAELRRNSGG